MALLDVDTFSRSGVDASAGDAASADGDRFPNTGKEILCVTNGSGSPVDITVESTIEVDDQAVADLTVTVGDGVSMLIGPFPVHTFSDEVNFSCSDETSIDVQVLKLNAGS